MTKEEKVEGKDLHPDEVKFKLHQFKPLMPEGDDYTVKRYAKVVENLETGDRFLIKGQGATIFRKTDKIGRNETCPKCKSGLKYKHCCGG